MNLLCVLVENRIPHNDRSRVSSIYANRLIYVCSFNSHNCLYNYVCFYRWGNRGTERLSNWAKVTEQTCNGVTALVPSSLAPEDFLKPTDNSESIKQ